MTLRQVRQRPTRRSLLCLVVGGDYLARETAVAGLQRQGFETEAACTGEQALGKALSSSYDLVLLSAGLPDMSPPTLVHRMRRHCAVAGTPIVAVGENADDSERELMLASGCTDYIPGSPSTADFERWVRAFATCGRGGPQCEA